MDTAGNRSKTEDIRGDNSSPNRAQLMCFLVNTTLRRRWSEEFQMLWDIQTEIWLLSKRATKSSFFSGECLTPPLSSRFFFENLEVLNVEYSNSWSFLMFYLTFKNKSLICYQSWTNKLGSSNNPVACI